METSEKVRENRLRRQAQRLGLELRKSRARRIHIDDHGGYMLIDGHYNAIVAGQRFDLGLDDVEEWLNGAEAETAASRKEG